MGASAATGAMMRANCARRLWAIAVISGCGSSVLAPNQPPSGSVETDVSGTGSIDVPRAALDPVPLASACESRVEWPEVPVLKPVSENRLAYADGTLWERGRVAEEPSLGESLLRVCELHSGQRKPQSEVLLELPGNVRAWELSAVVESLGVEGYVTVQVRQGRSHVRLGVAPYHPDVPFPEDDESDHDVLVVYKWASLNLAIVRGVERRVVVSREIQASKEICSEELREAVSEVCAHSRNDCRRVSVILGDYDGAIAVVSLLALLDSAVPIRQLRLLGLRTQVKASSARFRVFPSGFVNDLYHGDPCGSQK